MQPWRSDEAAPRVRRRRATTSGQNDSFEAALVRPPAPRTRLDPVLALAADRRRRRGACVWCGLLCGIIRLARFSRARMELAPPPAATATRSRDRRVSALHPADRQPRPVDVRMVRPTVALPSGFDALAPEFQRAVICHELLHIKRRDITVAFSEELAVAALWFHPWMWLFRARIRVAREQVVDGTRRRAARQS